MKNKQSVDTLKAFIQKEYIDNPEQGSPSLFTAVRDVLTDLLHLGDSEDINIQSRLLDAEDVHQEEAHIKILDAEDVHQEEAE
jgi:hypothetical protein